MLSIFGAITCKCQDFNFGAVTLQEYNFDKKTIDSNANAIVIREFGKGAFQMNFEGHIDIAFTYHVKIKIFNKEAFKKANIVVPLYKGEYRDETIEDLKASTFNLIDGKISETSLDNSTLITENKSKYINLAKFTLPNLKEGSIIEYSYKLISPNVFNFKTWEFQTDIPKAFSEFNANIPATYNYNVSLRGDQKLNDQKAEVLKKCFTFAGTLINCSKLTYVMKNIPAFIEEDYMTAPSNFKSAIHFELSEYQHLNAGKIKYTKTWKDIEDDLLADESFGVQMRKSGLFKNAVSKIVVDNTDNLEMAKAIYVYIKKQIKWNNQYGKYTTENLKKALELKSGNVADINLCLIAALQAAGLDVEAVVLSTRENGVINKLYPVISEFDYVIAKVNINNESYLLDATDPLLPFGLLPFRCINDKGRVINLKKPSYWIDLKCAQKTTKNYLLNGLLSTDGKISGNLTIHSQGYAALNKRKQIKGYSSIDEFVEDYEESIGRIKIKNYHILNLDSVENTLTEHYDVEIKINNDLNKDNFYFNPFLINSISKNPFNLNERNYPIDLATKSDDRVTINLVLPEGFKMDEKPKNLSISLKDNSAKYLLQTDFENNAIQLNQTLQLNNAIYQPSEYLNLKEFYSKIIQNQKTDFLFKKIK